jgi:hypothetical protein
VLSYPNTIRQSVCLLGLFIAGCGPPADEQVYEVDRENPRYFVGGGRPVPIREIRVIITGPKEGFDTQSKGDPLLAMAPAYRTRDPQMIEAALAVIGAECVTASVDWYGCFGYTYHILLLEDGGRRLVHFRVFSPELDRGGPLAVFPRSDTGFWYCNDKIAVWLHEVTGRQQTPAAVPVR